MRPCLALLLFIAAPAVLAQAAPSSAPAPMQANPAAAPIKPASDAGATERGLAPVQPATGVTQRVRNAGEHDTDAEGHTLDPHGKPVGQLPAPTSSR
ncbi:hypothetical protein [Luteibacter yeojuensis]|uniref:Uncharacterized protein n=1 Tax=Luteibacter yeojuensis TaxID=345309 RepID=A0A0F3KGM5_9GAMM|nr:hypothetical protein [Luteibacter yeojuensis]KJV30410.1 hypothetical protein VI08_14960 [Luteibacter yeojuensis]